MTPAPKVAVDWKPRLAREADIPALEALIPVSVRALQAPALTQRPEPAQELMTQQARRAEDEVHVGLS